MCTINQRWEFQKLPNENMEEIHNINQLEIEETLFEHVDLPHTWYQDSNSYKGTVVYRKRLLQTSEKDERMFLNFQAADRWCKVFVNQSYAGEHKGGYSSFTFDITKYCIEQEEIVIEVFLDNQSWDEISPLVGDFTVFGGLYRDVSLIRTNKICFDRTYYGTNGVLVNACLDSNQTGKVSVEPHVLGVDKGREVEVVYQIFSPDGEIVMCQTGVPNESKQIDINKPDLWEGKKRPAMYRLHTELKADGITVDVLDISFGFRSIWLDAQKGFFLNGIHMKLNGVAKHQDYAGVYHATRQDHWNQDMNDIIEIGANSVRLSHYQHPQEMYRLCDENGLVVWAEIPMLKFTDSNALYDNACIQLKELILQNLNHPSICFWGIQNEIAMFGENELMYQRLTKMKELAETLDPTRICASANLFCVENQSPLNRITPAVGYNIYFGWYYGEMKDSEDFIEKFHQDNPDIPLGITEYGVDCNLAYHSEHPKVKDYTEEFQTLYHETVYPMFQSKPYIWGTYVWNLYDFSSEIREEGGVKYKNGKGLISYDRQVKKDAFYYYKSQWSSEPFVKIAQSRFKNRTEPDITLNVYSNQKEVTLTVNEESYMQYSDRGVFYFKGIALKKGRNVVKAVSGQYQDKKEFYGVDSPDKSYIYVDETPGLNVKNWFTDALEEEKMFPKGKLSIRDSCKTILEHKEAMNIINECSPELAKQMSERMSLMPLERILSYMKKEISEEQCKELNARLTNIVKEIVFDFD